MGKSEVRKLFFCMLDNDGKKKTKCKLCRAELSYSASTSAMRNHMKMVHKKSDQGHVKRQTSLFDFNKKITEIGASKY